MSDIKCTDIKAMKNSSYIAWLSIAAAEYLDLGLTREQLVCLCRECIEVARLQNDFKLNYYCCITLLPLISDISAPPSTLEYFEASYKLAKVHGDANLEMIISLVMATEYKELHRFQDSILYAKRSLNIAKKIGDKSAEKRAYLILLKINDALDKYDEVIVYSKLCLSLVDPTEDDDDRSIETCAYYHLGKAYYSLYQYHEAIFYSRKCLDVYQGADGTKHLAMNACLQLVRIYQSLNRHEDAINFGKKSIKMSKQCNDKSVEMEAHLLLCTSYDESKQFNKCLLCSQEAIKAARTTCNQEGEMLASLSRARTYLSLKQYDDAIIWGKKCVDLALINIFGRNYIGTKKVDTYGQMAMSLSYIVMAEAHLKLEEYEDCILNSKKAITITKTLKKQKTEEKGYFLLGQAYKALHRYDECILYWQKCIEIAELINSKNTTMSVHKSLGQMYFDCLKKHHNAMSHFKKCLEYAKDTGEAFIEMVTNLEIARIYYWFEDIDNAVLHIKKTLATAEEIGDKTTEAEAYLELGKCYVLTKQYDDAILFTNKSIDIAKQIGNKIVEINAYLVIARIHNQQGQHNDAITFNDKCNDIAEEIGEQTSEITGHWQMGQTYYDTNRYEEAIFHLNKCIDMANGIDNKYVEMKAWVLLGKNYDKLQQYEEVVRCTERCIGIVLEPEEKKDKMEALFLSGRAHYCLNQYDDSFKNFYKCIDIAKNLGETLTEMQAYCLLGNTFVKSGRTNDALVYGEKCLRIALEIGEKETEMDGYMLLGNVYFNLEEREDAILYYTKCLDIAKEIGVKKIEITAYVSLADTYIRMGKHGDAICYGNKALTIAQETGERGNEMNAYVTLGKAYFNKNMYDDAIEYSKKCLSTAQETNQETCKKNASTEQGTTVCDIKGSDDTIRYNPVRITLRAYLVLVQSYCSLNKRGEALICIQNCNNIKNEMNDTYDKMCASFDLSEMYNSMKQFEDAVYHGKQCAELAIETGNKNFEKDSYCRLRNLYLNAKQYQDYLVYSNKCVQIVKEYGSKTNEMYALHSLGDAYFLLNENENAISTLKRCIEKAEGAGDEHSNIKMDAYFLLARSYNSLAKFKDSIGYYKICIHIAKEINEPLVELNALSLCANAYISLNQYGEAYAHITEGLTIAHNLKDNFRINEFNTLLRVLYKAVGMTEEIVCDTKLEADDIETEDDMKHNIRKFMVYFDRYLYHRSQKNYEEAIACLEEAIKAAVQNGKDSFFFFANIIIFKKDIAELYILQGQYNKGIQHYQEGLALALKFDNKHHQALFHFGLGKVYYVLKETEKAERSLRESIKCFEFMFSNIGSNDKFKIAIVDKYKNVHELLLKVLIEKNKNEEALVLADHFRALALKDILVSNYGMKEETAKGGLQYTDIQTLVSSKNYAILLFSVCLEDIYTFLVEAGEEYKFSVRYFKYCDRCFDEIIEKSYTEMKVREVVNCENRSLDALLDAEVKGDSPTNMRGHAEEPSEDNEDKSMKNASEIFYHRILPKLILEATSQEIVILPDGFLHKVPFAALQDPDTGRYLSETKRIRLAPSISIMKLLSENAGDYHSNEGALIIGDPLVGKVMFNGEEKEFDPLKHAFVEARAVANLFHVTPLTRETATKSAVIESLKQGVAVVHIAAHSSLTKGTIALAPSPEMRAAKIPEEEDYMLTMAEVQQAQVRAQLVVLSCCHSGRGEIRAEGVVGMCRAFLASGARAVVASLWAIDDKATLEFMVEFYFRLIEGKSASVSLQQAMEEIRKCYSEPKYWAPFFLMGDDVTIE